MQALQGHEESCGSPEQPGDHDSVVCCLFKAIRQAASSGVFRAFVSKESVFAAAIGLNDADGSSKRCL